MTVKELISELSVFPPDAQVQAGEIQNSFYLSDDVQVAMDRDGKVSITA